MIEVRELIEKDTGEDFKPVARGANEGDELCGVGIAAVYGLGLLMPNGASCDGATCAVGGVGVVDDDESAKFIAGGAAADKEVTEELDEDATPELGVMPDVFEIFQPEKCFASSSGVAIGDRLAPHVALALVDGDLLGRPKAFGVGIFEFFRF